MPSNRRRTARHAHFQPITPSELQWLSGRPQPGANPFWIHARDLEKVVRARHLIAMYGHLIPRGRRRLLEADLCHWAPPPRRVK